MWAQNIFCKFEAGLKLSWNCANLLLPPAPPFFCNNFLIAVTVFISINHLKICTTKRENIYGYFFSYTDPDDLFFSSIFCLILKLKISCPYTIYIYFLFLRGILFVEFEIFHFKMFKNRYIIYSAFTTQVQEFRKIKLSDSN